MTKSDLINALKSEFDITKNVAQEIVKLVFYKMSNALLKGYRIELL